jgi:hypothetical protein
MPAMFDGSALRNPHQDGCTLACFFFRPLGTCVHWHCSHSTHTSTQGAANPPQGTSRRCMPNKPHVASIFQLWQHGAAEAMLLLAQQAWQP